MKTFIFFFAILSGFMMLSSSSNETVVAVQIMFITLQNTFEIRENKTKAKYEICSKLTIKTVE